MNMGELNINKYNSIKSKIKSLYDNKKIKIVIFFLICIVTFFMMYKLNNSTGFTSDDYRYHYMYENVMPTDDVQRIQSFTDVITSMKNHYYMWGGRITAHTLLQLFLMYDKAVFNIANSIVFVLLALLIYLHCNTFKKIKCSLFMGIVMLLWFFIPEFGLTVLWVSGSFNYLWCTSIILAFLLPYRLYIEKDKITKDSFINMVLMFLFGIIAGCTNENSGGAMVLLQILFILYYIFNKKVIPKWGISGLLGSIIGFTFLVVAPGNYLRNPSSTKLNLLYRVKKAMINLISIIINSYKSTWGLIIILTIIIIILVNFDKLNKAKIFIIPLMYFVSAIAGIGALILSPEVPQRTWFGPVVFIIISIGYLYCKLDFNNIIIKQFLIASICLFSISFFMEYRIAYSDIKITHNQVVEQIETIKKQKELGNNDIKIKKISKPKSTYNAFYGSANLNDDKESWFNRWMAKYYEVDFITGEN